MEWRVDKERNRGRSEADEEREISREEIGKLVKKLRDGKAVGKAKV